MSTPPTDLPILGLHEHSYFSTLDGASSPGAYVEYAKENGLPACAVTDHGNLSAVFDQACSCEKHGVKGIYGIELYLLPFADYQVAPGNKPVTYFHLTLWALNPQGYRNLVALASQSWSRVHKGRALTTWDALGLYADGVACGSGCLLGPVAQPFIRGERAMGVRALCTLREIYGDRLFLEIMPHAVDRDYSGRNRQVVSVQGEDGQIYRFAETDMLETDQGLLSAKEACARRVGEIYGAAPRRVQDGEGLQPTLPCPTN